jgi:hypothetical protein
MTGISEGITCERLRGGTMLWQKLSKIIKFKVHPIILDSNINSLFTGTLVTSIHVNQLMIYLVRLNVYQLFLFVAIKFHLHARELAQPPQHNPPFFTSTSCQ